MNRRIDVGEIISRVFSLYGEYANVLLPVAAVLFLVHAAVLALTFAATGLFFLSGLTTLLLSILFTGLVVRLVEDVRDGRRDQSVGDLLRSVGPVFGALLVVSILAGIGIALGFVLLIVPGLFLITIWAVVAPVTVIEHPGIGRAFGRSRELVRGFGWETFGVIVVLFVLTALVSAVFALIGAALGNGGRIAFGFIGSVLTAPVTALGASVLYFRLREAHGELGTATAGEEGPATERPAFG